MNTERLSNGIFLIFIGLLLLLSNIGVINWSIWQVFFRLWPLLLILGGINILLKNRPIVTIISSILFFTIFIGYGFIMDTRHPTHIADNYELITIEKSDTIQEAQLNLKVGGVKLDLSKAEDDLLMAHINTNRVEHTFDEDSLRQRATLDFESINHGANFIGSSSEDYSFYLSEDILWDIDAKVGAVAGELDFSSLKLQNLDLSVGAGNLDLVFGTALEASTIALKGGASNITITLPEDAGVKVKLTGLVSKSAITKLGWEEIGDYYYSPNYENATSKLHFDISIGVGNIDFHVR